jgi:hypothetical protein
MNISQKPFEIGCYSIKNIEDTPYIIHQKSMEIHQHEIHDGYLVLSKNDFGKVKKRINVGIFNKKTNFVVGEKNSLIFWDNEEKILVSKNISEILEEPKRYFMIYDLNFIGELQNEELNIQDKETKETLNIILNKQFGYDIGSFLKMVDPKTTDIPDEFSILKSIIVIENGKLSINKYILINSNIDFLIGILEGYLGNQSYFVLKSNINIYNFTYILNLLGAQYSIRSLENREKHIRFKLPLFLKVNSKLHQIFFRSCKYFFEKVENNYHLYLKKDMISLMLNPKSSSFFEMVNSGLIEMIPIKDLVFVEVQDEIMYDMTMTRSDATNYCMPGGFYSKNSDGDILGVIALLSEDGSREAIQKFSTELKENFLNLSTGDTSNWGVKLDSQVGLYSATK